MVNSSVQSDVASRENLADTLKKFGAGVLSPRDNMVIQLVLLGHSTHTAVSVSGIAEGTIKADRRHSKGAFS